MAIIVASPRAEILDSFAAAVAEAVGVAVLSVESGARMLEMCDPSKHPSSPRPELVIVDSMLMDIPTKTLLVKLMTLNASINSAVLSPLPEEHFHERYEGLGIMAQLNENPTAKDAQTIAEQLRELAPDNPAWTSSACA